MNQALPWSHAEAAGSSSDELPWMYTKYAPWSSHEKSRRKQKTISVSICTSVSFCCQRRECRGRGIDLQAQHQVPPFIFVHCRQTAARIPFDQHIILVTTKPAMTFRQCRGNGHLVTVDQDVIRVAIHADTFLIFRHVCLPAVQNLLLPKVYND